MIAAVICFDFVLFLSNMLWFLISFTDYKVVVACVVLQGQTNLNMLYAGCLLYCRFCNDKFS